MAFWYSIPSNYYFGNYSGSTSNISLNFNASVSGYYRVFIPYDYTYNNLLFDINNISNIPSNSTLSGVMYSSGNRFITISYSNVSHVFLNRGYMRGRTRVWRSGEKYEGFYYFTPLETTTLSGKYKIPATINTVIPNLIRQGTIPIKCTLNGENYNYIMFPDIYSQYDSISSSMSNNNYAVSFYKSPIDLGRTTVGNDEGYINIMQTPTSTSSNVVATEYANSVIDFGEVGQEVPTIFKTWLESVFEPVYSNSYTVKDFKGENVLASITESPSMVNASLSTIGNEKTLTLTGSNGREYSLVWSSPTPEETLFLGLSNSPNSNRVILPNNSSIGVSWEGDLVLYEAYGKYRPPTTVFDINLYQNSAEVNRVDKGQFLIGVGTLSGALRNECSMLTPSIVYQSSDVPTFNYVYIPIFNRYYYVTSLSSVSKNVWRMELNCDVLMTYKEQIFLLQGVVGRQENEFNPLLVDTEIPAQSNPIIQVIDIPSDAFNTQTSDEGHNFLMTVIGA